MKYYAVIDTNVLVAFLLTNNRESSVYRVMQLVKEGTIIPLLHSEIVQEYKDVLSRDKLKLDKLSVSDIIEAITTIGINCDRKESTESFPDPDDIVFYEVSLSIDEAYLITGNLKHFPQNGHVVTPAEMLQIIHLAESSQGNICEPTTDYMIDHKRKIIERGWQTIEKIRTDALQNGLYQLTIDNINQIIRDYRQEKNINVIICKKDE